MVTMNGEECHNEWEITHEEIHRNGALLLPFIITDILATIFLKRGLRFNGNARFWHQKSNFLIG
jgi:maltose phosphorylase